MTSCVVKRYETPTAEELKLDSLYKYATDTTKNIAQTPWREIFTDKNLQELIDTVLAGNFDAQVALLTVEQSYAMLRSARAQMVPTLGADVSYSGTSTSENGSMGKYNSTLSGTLSLGWEVDIWGRLYASKEASKASFWQTQEAVAAVQQSLIAATATAYYNLVALDATKLVIEDAIINRAEYLMTTRDLKESGKVNEVAVQQAIAQLAEVEAALFSVNLAIETAESSLALLAGRTSIEVKRELLIECLDDIVLLDAGTPVQLLSYRADVREAEMNYRSKHYLFMASRAAMYPSLSIGGSVGINDVISAQNLVLGTLAGITAPIFNGRKLRASKESAEAEAKIAKLQFQEALYSAVIEVNNAMLSIQSYDAIVKNQMIQLLALQNAYEYSGDLFLSGYASYLDLLVAQTSVYSIQTSIVESMLSTITSRIELYRAVGGGALDVNTTPETAQQNDPAITQ